MIEIRNSILIAYYVGLGIMTIGLIPYINLDTYNKYLLPYLHLIKIYIYDKIALKNNIIYGFMIALFYIILAIIFIILYPTVGFALFYIGIILSILYWLGIVLGFMIYTPFVLAYISVEYCASMFTDCVKPPIECV